MPHSVLICGDPHGKFRHIVKAALELQPVAVLLLGDLQPLRPLHEELRPIQELVWFIHGNHDTDSTTDFENTFDSDLGDRNLHGRVITLSDGHGNDVRVAGLGGIFRSSVWYPPADPAFYCPAKHARATPRQQRWRNGPALRHWSTIYPDVVDRLAAETADILITHEAPSCHPNGFALIDDLARAMRVSATFHGHHHDRLDYSRQWSSQGFRSFGVGLGGISDMAGDVVVAGEIDHVRQIRQKRVDEDWKRQ